MSSQSNSFFLGCYDSLKKLSAIGCNLAINRSQICNTFSWCLAVLIITCFPEETCLYQCLNFYRKGYSKPQNMSLFPGPTYIKKQNRFHWNSQWRKKLLFVYKVWQHEKYLLPKVMKTNCTSKTKTHWPAGYLKFFRTRCSQASQKWLP